MHAELCPVCEGKGINTRVTVEWDTPEGREHEHPTCHGCDGRGWVPVEDDKPTPPKFAIHSHPVEVLEAVPSETKCSHPGDTLYTGGCFSFKGDR